MTDRLNRRSSLARAAHVDPNLRTVFKVKYVAEGVAYLDGGRSSGLTEGMKLEIRDSDLPAAAGRDGRSLLTLAPSRNWK